MGKALYAFLEDGLYNPPVVAQDVYFAARTDASLGAGTAEDPYRANSASDFDALMNDASKTPSNTTIHLGPGTFYTGGYVFTPGSSGTGWQPRSGHRIVGAGISETTLQLTGLSATAPAVKVGHAIGMDLTSSASFLQGFELSDLTIDANVLPGGAGNSGSVCGGAVSITGRDIYIKRVRVINFGGRGASTVFNVVLAGKAKAGQSYLVQNNVVEGCIFQTPGEFSGSPTASARLIAFEGETSSTVVFAVNSSVVRGCDIDAALNSNPITAISPGVGLGMIIEENQVYNCKTGLELNGSATQDLVVWDNYFQNVVTGMSFSNTGTGINQAKRIVLLNNTISLPNSTSTGIIVTGSSTSYNFLQFVVRNNLIRDVTFPSGVTAGMTGISLANVQEAIAENNVINNCAPVPTMSPPPYIAALVYDSTKVQYMKSFNNQSTAGALMRAYDSATGRSLQELADAAQDSLMVF